MRLLGEYTLVRGTVRQDTEQAAWDILPAEVRRAILLMPFAERSTIEEVRLRSDTVATVTVGERERILTRDGKLLERDPLGRGIFCRAAMLRQTVEKAADGFLYGAEETLKQGFITLRGGHRCGVIGQALEKNGEIAAFGSYSAICLRIARDVEGIAAMGADGIVDGVRVRNTLILSAPSVGKTTYLRDMVRTLARRGFRIGLCDERGELAALRMGVPQFDLGGPVDVIGGCAKSEGMLLMLRSMSPQILAVDEITASKDVEAILQVANCGVRILATAHADEPYAIRQRAIYAPLWQNRVFSRVLVLSRCGSSRTCAIYDAEEGGECGS